MSRFNTSAIPMIRFLVNTVISMMNKLYRGRPFARFFVLETLACGPYVAYLSVLNLYENLGLWRQLDWLKIHFSESWNELHHLLIMQTLDGDKHWFDRLLARAITIVYHWILVSIYIVNPSGIYRFMELVARHAYADYGRFLDECEKELIIRPVPRLTISDFQEGDLYLFDKFRMAHSLHEQRPPMANLYDVFAAIQDEEMERVKMMVVCQKPNAKLEVESSDAIARPKEVGLQ